MCADTCAAYTAGISMATPLRMAGSWRHLVGVLRPTPLRRLWGLWRRRQRRKRQLMRRRPGWQRQGRRLGRRSMARADAFCAPSARRPLHGQIPCNGIGDVHTAIVSIMALPTMAICLWHLARVLYLMPPRQPWGRLRPR